MTEEATRTDAPQLDAPPEALPTWTEMPDDLRALLRAEISLEDEEDNGLGTVVDAEIVGVDAKGLTLKLDDGRTVHVAPEDACDRDGVLADEVSARVRVSLDQEKANGSLVGSLVRARDIDRFHQWQERARKGGETFEVEIQHVVRGGFAVNIEGIRGFLPGRDAGIRRQDAFLYIGETLKAELVGFDDETAQPRLSRQHLAAEEDRTRLEAAIAHLEPGARITGRVTRIAPFGAFVDIGGVQGLLHVSEMSLQRVDDPGEVLQVGDEVDVTLLEVDAERGRIALSRRELLGDEARTHLASLEPGTLLEGRVVRLAPFGAFVEISPGLEGLCHISELSWTRRVQDPAEMLQVDEVRTFKLLERDGAGRRIGLSLRQTEPNPWEAFAEAHNPGDLVQSKITRIEPYGLFLEVAPGVEGLCHVSDLSWSQRPEKPSDIAPFSIGQSLEVRVLSIEPERPRLKLGLKQVEADPWNDAGDKLQPGAIFEGRVTRIDDPFAWIEVAPNLEGRLHVADVSMERVEHLRLALRVDQVVQVMTVEADAERRRIRLSIKAIAEKELAEGLRSWKEDETLNPLAAALAPQTSETDDTPAPAEPPAEDPAPSDKD